MKKSVNKKRKVSWFSKRSLLTILLMIIISFTAYNILPLHTTGFATMIHRLNYSDNINVSVDDDQTYTWSINNYGKLKSIELEGSISKHGSAKVYLEHNEKSYVIFDSLKLSETAHLTNLIVENTISNEDAPITLTQNGSGRKNINKLFEFNVNNVFNQDIDYSKLCTKWDINNINICNGAEDCCNLMGLDSSGKWNNSLYLSYGRYGTELNNIVKLQIIYANYSLDIESPYEDIIYSPINEFKAEFYEKTLNFKDICIDTCLLPDLNGTSYELLFIIDNANLSINNIGYSIEKEIEVSDNIPELVKNIDNITIYKNEEFKINLSSYFTDKDNNKLTYFAYKANNLSILIKNSIAKLIPAFNFTGKRYTYFTASDGYYNMTSNVFKIEVIEKPLQIEDVKISEELIKPQIMINRPVRWVKKVNISASVINLSINISSNALNVTVKNLKEDKIINEDKIKVNDKGIIKNSSAFRAEKRLSQIDKIEDKLTQKKTDTIREDPTAMGEIGSINRELRDLQNEKNKLTGYVVAKKEKGLLTRFFEWLFNVKITGYVVLDDAEEITSNTTSVIIEDIVEEIEIEYYTEGPISEEENISNGKKVVISSEVHYEDILAYTYLNDIDQSSIKLYWIVNESRVLVNEVDYYDENENGLIDVIEWIVPSLSNQTYEVIIEISDAKHLDANKNFIDDIYDYVEEQDNNWTLISNGEYIRVTFESPLDSSRDITIHARSNESSSIEVYTENGNEIIITFENILEEDTHKVYLTNLEEGQSYETFDLKINGNIEFDYIVDPTCPGGMSGSGIEGEECMITDCENLQNMSGDLTIVYELNNNIDCSNSINWNNGTGFDPIGDSGTYFTGGFTTSTYTISNLFINRSTEDYVGLFGYVDSVDLTGVYLINVNITGNDNVGGLTGYYSGSNTISNSYVTGKVVGADSVGGLVGNQQGGLITQCYTTTDVNGSDYVGGLVGGANTGSGINHSYTTGNVNGSSTYTGGLVGDCHVAVANSYATGNISGSSQVGGLLGSNYVSLANSFATGNVTSTSNIGSLIGTDASSLSITNNYWNNHSGNPDSCYSDNGNTNCIAIQNNANYFKDDVYPPKQSREPFASWDFTSVWVEYSGDYPVLQWQSLGSSVESTNVYACGTLGTADTTYTLQSNLNSTVTCFTITANSITLDFSGYNITGANTGYGVYVENYNDTTILDGGIYDFNYGITFSDNKDNNITNMALNSNNYNGIYIVSSSSNTIIDNTILNSNNNNGIYIVSSSSNTIIDNTINSNSQSGISVIGNNNNVTNNNIWNCSTEGNYACVYVVGDSNIVTDNKINLSAQKGIWVDGDHNVFSNTNLTNIAGVSIHIEDNEINNTFINFTYNNETVDSGGQLIRQWNYRAYVNDTDKNIIENANVSIYNVSGNLMYNMTTDATGYTSIYNIIDYVNNGGTKTYYSNYTIIAKNLTHDDSHKYNVSANENKMKDVFTISDNTLPVINKVNITPTVGPSGTIFNISVNATDNVQIDAVIAYIQKPDENNTFNLTLSLTNNLYNGTWNSSNKADGTYVIDIIANDTSGNQKELENSAIIALSSTAQSTFVNSSINFIANTSITINATEETDTWLNITTNANTTASITIAEYSNNIESVTAAGVTELGKYISIIIDNNTNNNISYAQIRVYYTDAELRTANLTESTLRLYKFNTSSNSWYAISPGGVNTNLNYVWGNISRFSSFGIFGSKPTSAATTSSSTASSRAKAICTPEWDCTEWSECLNRIQTRTCRIKGTCYNYQNEPETIKECGIDRKIGIDLSKTEEEIGFFDTEVETKDNDLNVKLIIRSKEGKEINDLEIEFNLNQKRSTKILDYIGPFSIKDKQTIKKTYDAKQLKNGEYEVNIKLYKKGKKIEELTNKIIINKKEATDDAFKITGNVIALDRKGIKEESRFIPLTIIFIILFSLGIIRDIVKEK